MKRLFLIIVLLLIPMTAFATGENLYPTEDEENGKWGYVDDSDHWIIPASFDSAAPFRGGYATVTVYPDGMEPAELTMTMWDPFTMDLPGSGVKDNDC